MMMMIIITITNNTYTHAFVWYLLDDPVGGLDGFPLCVCHAQGLDRVGFLLHPYIKGLLLSAHCRHLLGLKEGNFWCKTAQQRHRS